MVLTNRKPCGKIAKLFEMSESLKQFKKLFQKLLKKCLTMKMSCGNINESLAKAAQAEWKFRGNPAKPIAATYGCLGP